MAKDKSKRAAAAAKRLEKNTEEVKTPEVKKINQKEVNKFVNNAPLTTNNFEDDKTTVVSFYITETLKNKLDKVAENKKVLKSKVIRVAENLYYNSKLRATNKLETSLDKKDKKVTCAFIKSALIERAKEKGFKKQTDYLNAVLINKLDNV